MFLLLWFIAKTIILASIALIVLLISTGVFPTWRRYSLIQKLPGPKGLFLLGNTVEMIRVPVEDVLSWISLRMIKYDRMMRMWFLVVSDVFIKEPNDIQELLNNTRHIGKGLLYNLFKPWLGEGLLTSNGEKWHSRRKLLTPAFHFRILEENMSVFNKYSKILCEKLKQSNGEDVAIESYLTLCTLDIIVNTAMGKTIHAQTESGQEYVQQLKTVTKIIMKRLLRPYLFLDMFFNISFIGRKFFKAVSYLHNFSYSVITERKGQINNFDSSGRKSYKPFLDIMLELELNKPGSLSDQDIREEVDTFMFEGHDTTSVALVYIFYNLGKYSDIQSRVLSELKDIFDDSDRETSVNDLQKMIYLEKVIKESLRLYPSVPIISRRLEKDLILSDGIIIPARSNVLTPIYLVHKNPKYWQNPDIFDPERFNEDENQNRHPYSYLPFSAGSRNCIGQKFAMMELKTIVSTIVRQFEIVPVSRDEDFKLLLSVVLRTNKPIMCKFIPR